jgi:hypothetical protein
VEVEKRKLEVLIKKFADDTKGAKVIKDDKDRDELHKHWTSFAIGQTSGA